MVTSRLHHIVILDPQVRATFVRLWHGFATVLSDRCLLYT
jgi:hypothetical protein